jgi:hypothetical protein
LDAKQQVELRVSPVVQERIDVFAADFISILKLKARRNLHAGNS